MAFIARPIGTTIRRAERMVHEPHGAGHEERQDPDFVIAMRCNKCDKLGHGPRSQIKEAMEEHKSQCSARHTKADEPWKFQILYPKQ